MINENLAYTFLVTRNCSLMKNIKYNQIIKRFSHIGSEGKKFGEKLVDITKTKNPFAKTNGNIKQKNPHWKKPPLKKTNNHKDNYHNKKKFTDIKQKNNKEFIFPKKNKNPFEDLVKKHPIDHENGNLKKNFTEFKNTIPTPPSMPTKLLIKPIEKLDVTPINNETLESAKKNLKCQFHIPKETKINKNTTPENISKKELFNELISRGMAKLDDKPGVTKLIAENGDIEMEGQIANVKLSSLGIAHLVKLEENVFIPNENIEKYDKENFDYFLSVPITRPTEDTCLFTGKQTHIIAVVVKKKTDNDNNTDYNIIGYLTSQKQKIVFCNTQFEIFQKSCENKNIVEIDANKKQQFFKPLNFMEKIKKEDFIKLKYSKEYLDQKEGDIRLIDKLRDRHAEIINNGIKIYKSMGYTSLDLLNSCKIFDKFTEEKKSHPQTQEQLENQEKGKEKQKKANEEKKLKNQNKNIDENGDE